MPRKRGLASLEGAPSVVEGTFDCADNLLKSLKHAPTRVDDDFICQDNYITEFDCAPITIGGDFYCNNNRLTSLKDIHKHIKEIVGGEAYFFNNKLKTNILGLFKIKGLRMVGLDDNHLAEIVNRNLGHNSMLACQEELIDAGLEEFAQL